jgi:uncharacterized protein HemY
MAPIGKMLLIVGLLVAAIGALLMFSDKIPFLGKLPGDISIKKENFQLYIPLTTCIVLSILLSLVMWLISFFSKK